MIETQDLAADTLAVVLAGGKGTRRGALTKNICKPALLFGAAYRNIDFTLSNCVNSGIRRIGVATQHKPASLLRRIEDVWSARGVRMTELSTSGRSLGGAGRQAGGRAAVSRNSRRKPAALLLITFFLSGCATTSLSPGAGVTTQAGAPSVAVSKIDGVSMSVQADAWQGDSAVTARVQQIRVTIHNDGDSPIRVRYSDFALIGPGGRRYAALPPFRVEGQILNPRLAVGYSPFVMPGFVYRRFYVAPYFAPLYPGMPVFRRHYYFYDPFYYDFYYMDLAAAIRPTVEMLSLALPEGVIEAGGEVAGFLYFEKVGRDVPLVTFQANLVAVGSGDGETGAAGADFGQISIPFTVTTTRP